MTKIKFSCIQGCSDCCVFREYYPSKPFGKIGVLLLPDEVPKIQALARLNGLEVKILPRLAIGKESPDRIIAYQMMGKNEDGDLCPFLNTESDERSPHGGFACRIYDERPLACRAYPLVDNESNRLDEHCRFCKEHSTNSASAKTLSNESEALEKIKKEIQVSDQSVHIWRYATATGRTEDKEEMFSEGWIIEG